MIAADNVKIKTEVSFEGIPYKISKDTLNSIVYLILQEIKERK